MHNGSNDLQNYPVLTDSILTEGSVLDDALGPGTYKRDFKATVLPSSVCFYRFEAGSFQETRQMVLLC